MRVEFFFQFHSAPQYSSLAAQYYMALIKYFIADYCFFTRTGGKKNDSERLFSRSNFIYYSTWILNLIYSLIGTFFTLDYSVTPCALPLRPNFSKMLFFCNDRKNKKLLISIFYLKKLMCK
jgi:hypothetical protein